MRVGEVSALEAARLRRGDLRRHPGVFAWALDDASPARVARYVEHRRKRQGDAVLRSLRGCGARRLLPEFRGEQAGLGQRNRKNRAVAMDDVQAQQQRNAEARFFYGETLDGTHLFRAPKIEQASDPPSSDPLVDVTELSR